MNVRFSENCRPDPLEFEDVEREIRNQSVRDGRTDRDQRLTCQQDLYLGIFFDGTNNNKYRDTASFSHSNVARLYEAYPGTPAKQTEPRLAIHPKTRANRDITKDEAFKPASVLPAEFQYYRKIYVPGVGTPMPDVGDSGTGKQKMLGLAMALLGQARLDWALLQVCNQVHAAVFGMPLQDTISLEKLYRKGTSTAKDKDPATWQEWLRLPQEKLQEVLDDWSQEAGYYDEDAFQAMLRDHERRLATAVSARGRRKPDLRKIRLSVFGFSRGAAKARAWVNMIDKCWGSGLGLAGIPVQIDFLGIFDTVASVGLAQSAHYANGHSAWAQGTNMVVPGSVKRCVHLVAAHEVRGSFPLDSVCLGELLQANCKEVVYPGVHSDVGGGYPPDDQGRALGAGAGAGGDALKLSQIPLAQMYREARMAGVPLAPSSDLRGFRKSNFNISPQLRSDFNEYVIATRSRTVPATGGRGDAQFARIFPTETQPRGSVMRIIRAHHGYLLQWRKDKLANGGAAALANLHASTAVTKHQDIEDIRGAEHELRKEIEFLQSKDRDKLDKLEEEASRAIAQSIAIYGPSVVASMLPAVVSSTSRLASKGLMAAVRASIEEKQKQWDSWLQRDWHGEGALQGGKTEYANKLFEHYVHDSRAWFKPMLTSDGQGLAPDDEDWFTLGGREKAKAAREKKLQLEIENCRKSGDAQGAKAAAEQLKRLQQEGQPLILGGREPYMMWGYVRHRRIYQSGVLADARHAHWQKGIEREEEGRERQATHERRIAQEKAAYESEVQRIKEASRRVQADPRLNNAAKNEHWQGTQLQLERARRNYEENLRTISRQSAETAQ